MSNIDREKKPGKINVYPSSDFDVSTPQGAQNFAGLMQFQYGLSDEEAEEWAVRAAREALMENRGDLLVEVTAPEHRFYSRLGQLMGAEHQLFVGSEELWRAGSLRSEEAEEKFALALNINSTMVSVPEGSFKLVEKALISADDRIEVEDEEGKKGLLTGWQSTGQRLPSGIYTARFGDIKKTAPDCLMLQDPRWKFTRKND